ncbi:MAG TPA: exodeoxyribonuclease VII large subunit, partial [Candidatus Polarisedimenticolaceae bacterium]|nr:exodeoxyribonuclease VII large subunit [Candidatus Polarisedimenticolaceae bacterium]
MSREVTHDGMGALQIRFAYERDLVDRIKTLPRRRWNGTERFWWVPDSDVVSLVDLLRPERFRFDAATRELYRRLGGDGALDDEPAPEAGQARFDWAETVRTDDLSVSRLNERVRAVLEQAFPERLWLVGEISGFDKNAHRRVVGFQLVECGPDGRHVAEVSATLFESTRREIERALREAGDPFRLEDEVAVRVCVRVDLHVPWGAYRVVVEELDLHYTLGEAARRREEILRRLGADGLLGRNAALPLPELPLRVGLITSAGSDACQDVLRTLEESGYAFEVVVHGARVQGRSTEPSVLNALDWFRAHAAEFDAVLICRGGGSRTDLAWFDSEPLGRAVALFPLPIVVGIGHEQDQSVLDAVGRRAKTPTAAAGLLVETVRETVARVERCGGAILEAAAAALAAHRRHAVERTRRL